MCNELPRGKPTECWVCRRTKEELIKQAKKDGLLPHHEDGNTILQEIQMYDGPFSKYICSTCSYMILDIADNHIKNLIRDEIIKLEFDG